MADLLHRGTIQLTTYLAQSGIPFGAFHAVQFHLDQAMRIQGSVDFHHDSLAQAVLADAGDRLQMMGLRAQGANFSGIQFNHGGILTR